MQNIKDMKGVTKENIDELIPPESLHFIGRGDFKKIGEMFFRYFIELCELKPDESVLDVGCGIGRMTLPLINYLKDGGQYQGFDINPTGINWCKEKITPKYPNFNFQLADIYNKQYNPIGKYKASEYKFPYEDESFDFVFLTSVFTHMLPLDMEHYFSEVARVLKISGKCLMTFFLLNAESLQLINAGKSSIDFKYDLGKCRLLSSHLPEAAICYDEALVLGLYEKYGLKVKQPIFYGRWSGRPTFLSHQDIIVASKEASCRKVTELRHAAQEQTEQLASLAASIELLSTRAAATIGYQYFIARIRGVVRNTLPPDTTVIVISKGDGELLKLDGRPAWHFPQSEDGIYAGYYPADSAEAIAHLEALRTKGGDFLLFPNTAFWWLEHYVEFRQHLESHYRVVVRQEETCLIFALRELADAQFKNQGVPDGVLRPSSQGTNMNKLRELFEQEATDIIEELSPEDIQYKVNRNLSYYFSVGQSALKCIKLAMLAAGKKDVKNILDLPCGHGRVLRTLKAAFPEAQITACDIDRNAVDFCARVFGATSVYSKEQPAQIQIKGNFDLIWCGSLLTHVNFDRWVGFLNLFNSLLSPDGILVFTIAGHYVAERLRGGRFTYGLTQNLIHDLLEDYDRDGFGYQDYPSRSNYGISLSSPPWVCVQLEKLPNLRLLNYTERGWNKYYRN
jgi:SAM-dependent methyltransferase